MRKPVLDTVARSIILLLNAIFSAEYAED